MSTTNDRVRWLYLSPDDLTAPPGGLMYVEMPDGGERLHICYSRAQLRAVLSAAPGTLEPIRRQSIDCLEGCSLPEESDLPESVAYGWSAGCLLDKMTDGGPGFEFKNDELDDFCDLEAGYVMLLPVDAGGTEAILAEFDVSGCRVWILPSRAAVRHKLEDVRGFADDEDYLACLQDLETSPLPEEDGERPMTRIAGGLGDVISCVLFCHQVRQQQES